jgi:hypothetical protein
MLIGASTFAQNLIHHWTFNRIAGTGIGPDYYIDYAGNGTLVPAGGGQSLPSNIFPGVADSLGDQAPYFAGNFWVEAQNPTNSTTWNGKAITFWARELHNGQVFQFPFGGAGVEMTPSGLVNCYFDGSSANPIQSQQNIKDGLWHFVVAQNDGSTTSIYIDGNLDTSTPETGFMPSSFNPQANIRVGGTRFGNRRITGQLDEMRVFDDVLSQAQIDSIYALSRPGVDLYKELNYKFFTVRKDSSLNDNNLGYNNGNRFTLVEDRNQVPGDSALNIGTSLASLKTSKDVYSLTWSSAAISIWVKNALPGGAAGNGRLVQGRGYGLDVDPNGNLLTFFDGTTANPLSTPANSAILDTNWHHVVAQNNGDTTFIYVDGNLEGTRVESMFIPTSLVGDFYERIFVGSGYFEASNGPRYYLFGGGLIDDFSLYSRSLAQVEIDELFQFGLITGEKASPKNPVVEVTVFPNPAVTHINLPSEVHNANLIKVFNLKGQKVLESPGKQEINVSDLDNGIYFLFIEKGGKIYRSKFMKQ